MQITFKLTEAELQEAVQQYITNLGVLPKGTETTVSLTGGGSGKNAEYGAVVEFDNTISPAMLAAAIAQPEAPTAAPVSAEQQKPVKTEKVEKSPETVVASAAAENSELSENATVTDADGSGAKPSEDTQVSSKEPDLTEKNDDNAPFNIGTPDGPKSKGVSLFNRPAA